MDDNNHEPDVAFPKPIEMKLPDVLFLAMRKHLIIFKDLAASKYIHYTMFMNGSLIDFHETFEDQDKHVPLLKIEFDSQFFLKRVSDQISEAKKTIFQTIKANDQRWMDLEIEVIHPQKLKELLSPLIDGAKYNINLEFLEKLERSMKNTRLGEITDCDLIMGIGSGYLVIGNRTECLLLDLDKVSKIIEKSFNSSIKKIYLKHYTLRTIFWYIKIKLLILIHSIL
jgi:hypothetical protein